MTTFLETMPSETNFLQCQNRWQFEFRVKDRAYQLRSIVALYPHTLASYPPLPPAMSQQDVNTAWLEALGSALRPGRFPVAMASCLWTVPNGDG
jgi:hypothetical protein